MKPGEEVIACIETFCRVPEGQRVGQPMELVDFQKKFILDVYDNPSRTRRAILSMGRKNGKTALLAAILLAHIVGPRAEQNSQIVSGALSREQAAILIRHAANMIRQDETLSELTSITPSSKRIIGLPGYVEYQALAAEGGSNMGLSPVLAVFDETGQVKGAPGSGTRGQDFLSAIMTSQGAHTNPLQIFISTQASADADVFSTLIDDAVLSKDPKTVVHLYAADPDCDLLDEEQWKKANPAVGLFRSEDDLREQLLQASRLPSFEPEARNLLLNQRVALESLAFAPGIVSENNAESDWQVFRDARAVHLGLDLSRRNDLSAAVLCAADQDNIIHVKTFGFTPLGGAGDRARRDKVPYDRWIQEGALFGPPGDVVDYGQVCQFLKNKLEEEGVVLASIQFDDWQIEEFKQAAEKVGFGHSVEWVNVRQGYQSMSPRVQALETTMLQRRLRLDNNPVMNMALGNAIVVSDAAGNRKVQKPKQNGPKIDALVALLQAVYPLVVEPETMPDDISFWIG